MTASALTPAKRAWYRALASLVTQHASLFWLIVLTITTLLVYASSLSYPFFWVDPIDIGLARNRSILQIFTTSQGYLYYRPFAFTLWKLLAALQGEYNPFAFHLVHLLTHVVNVWLIFALAKRVLRHTLAAGIAALFFAWYPFSYQTVTWVISPQPQATLFMLLSAILYFDGRTAQAASWRGAPPSAPPPQSNGKGERQSNLPDHTEIASSHPSTTARTQRGLPLGMLLAMTPGKQIWLSVLMLALALPFQENAASFGFVIAALEMLIVLQGPHPPATTAKSAAPAASPEIKQRFQERGSVRSPLLKTFFSSSEEGLGMRFYPLLHIGICVAFVALWIIIPKDPDSTIARFDQATGWYLLQGLIWPVAGAVGAWRVWFPALSNPAWAPLIVIAPIALLLLSVAYWRGRKLPLFFFGLIWYGVMVLPIWATRGFGYVGISPRILYVAAGSAVLIWAGLLTLDFRSTRVNRWWKVISGILVAAILAQSALFLNTRKTLHDQTMPAIWDVVNSGPAAGSEAKLLFINVPDQITPKWREFPVGFFRAVLMPVSVDLGQYVELQKGVRPQTQSLTVPALTHLEDYPYAVDMRGEAVDQAKLSAAIREADQVFITEYDPSGAVKIVEAGELTSQQSSQPLATFDSRIQLSGTVFVADSRRDKWVWNCLAPLKADETIFLHVFDANGQLIAQMDGDPLHDLFPLSECRPGEQIRDLREMALPDGTYTIKVGVYNRATQQRLTAIDSNGQLLPDNAITIRVATR